MHVFYFSEVSSYIYKKVYGGTSVRITFYELRILNRGTYMKNRGDFEKYYEINSYPFERLTIPIYTPLNTNAPLFKAAAEQQLTPCSEGPPF
jgi:hypothetical protein